MKSVCDDIRKLGVKSEFVVFDFGTGDYENLYKKLKEFEWFDKIGVLINNVGFLPYAYDCYEKFCVRSDQSVSQPGLENTSKSSRSSCTVLKMFSAENSVKFQGVGVKGVRVYGCKGVWCKGVFQPW